MNCSPQIFVEIGAHPKKQVIGRLGMIETAIVHRDGFSQVCSRSNGTHARRLRITLAELCERAKRRNAQERDVLHGNRIDCISSKEMLATGLNGMIATGPESKHKRELKIPETYKRSQRRWMPHAEAVVGCLISCFSEVVCYR